MNVLVTGGPDLSAAIWLSSCSMWAGTFSFSIIFRPASAGPCPKRRSSSRAMSAITDRCAGLLRRNEIDAILHFAGSIVVPDSLADLLGYYS